MNLRSIHIAMIVLGAFIIGIGGTMALNLWQTTSSKVPATYTTGEFAGEYNPADIRGSYSFGDIQEAFAVPVAALAEAFGVTDTDNPDAFLCKGLEDLYGQVENGEVGTDSVRWFVSLYTGLPYTPEADTLLPYPAITVLEKRLGEAELKAVQERSVVLPGLGSQEPEAQDQYSSELGEIKGKTTFGELLSWGVSKEAIEQALGLPIGKAGTAVRDYCIENGIEFSTVKEALQQAVDRALDKQ
jgi:hypothetical protein